MIKIFVVFVFTFVSPVFADDCSDSYNNGVKEGRRQFRCEIANTLIKGHRESVAYWENLAKKHVSDASWYHEKAKESQMELEEALVDLKKINCEETK